MRRATLLLLLWSCAAAAWAQGSTQAVCPIDGKSFAFQPPGPRTGRETYLDQRPVEPAAPWSLAKCPGNGFVVYKPKFSAEELGKLREIIATDAYRKLAETESTYYLESYLRRQLGEPPYDVAWALMQASWEVAADPARYAKYADEALAIYDSIALDSLGSRQRIVKQMLSGELTRRLGRFDSARERFLAMRDQAELATPFLQRVIEFQIKLIRARDAKTHRIPY